jgi:hypothetical protein
MLPRSILSRLTLAFVLAGCGTTSPAGLPDGTPDASSDAAMNGGQDAELDAGVNDATAADAVESDRGGPVDLGVPADSGSQDALPNTDATNADAIPQDSGSLDAVAPDMGLPDAVLMDALPPDAPAPDAATPDAGPTDSGFQIAPHPPLPQVPFNGGPLLSHPALVPITFQDDPNRPTLEAHAQWAVTSTWLTEVGPEYGVGLGSILGTGEIMTNAPTSITNDQLKSMLAGWIVAGTVPRPSDGTFNSVLYVVYLPSQSTITLTSTGGPTLTSCMDFGGFHEEMDLDGIHASYAVVNACPSSTPGLTDLEDEEVAASHEIFEAMTDRFPDTAPGWTFTQNTVVPWLLIGGELGDLCALPRVVYHQGQFYAQRIWSDAAAASGTKDPCAPQDPALPYYGVTTATTTVQVAAGGQFAFPLVGWSTAPVGAWGLGAQPGGGTFNPGVSVDTNSMTNGGRATLTVTVPQGTPQGGYALVWVSSALSMTDYHLWPLLILSN